MKTNQRIDEAEHRYEKYAVIAVAKWFEQRGYQVGISVPGPLQDILKRADLGGLEIPAFREDDLKNPEYRYTVYYDTPGHIDLVARSSSQVWVMEAKGIVKGGSAPGAVAQAIGQVVLLMMPTEPTLRYAIILPDEKRFIEVLKSVAPDNPVLTRPDLRIFLVSKDGSVRCRSLADVLARS